MGARKPDGGAARTERVSFTRPAAERIAKVVRTVEQGNRGAAGLSFAPRAVGGGGGKAFRVCTFTGAWSKTTAKTLTFHNQTTTPNTVVATNLLYDVPAACGGTATERKVAIARDGTAWHYVNHEHEFSSTPVSVGHFNGAWAKGETKTLSFEDGAPNYIFATNYLGDIEDAGVRRCYLVRIGCDLHLLAAECVPLT